jgi:hypothetical protein
MFFRSDKEHIAYKGQIEYINVLIFFMYTVCIVQ